MPGPDAGHSGKNKVNEFDQDAYVGLRPLDGHCAPHGSLVHATSSAARSDASVRVTNDCLPRAQVVERVQHDDQRAGAGGVCGSDLVARGHEGGAPDARQSGEHSVSYVGPRTFHIRWATLRPSELNPLNTSTLLAPAQGQKFDTECDAIMSDSESLPMLKCRSSCTRCLLILRLRYMLRLYLEPPAASLHQCACQHRQPARLYL